MLLTFIMITCVCIFFTMVFIYREYFKSKFEKLVQIDDDLAKLQREFYLISSLDYPLFT